MELTYTVILRPEPEGEYTVLVPALPGCLTCGATIGQALRSAEEAIALYVECLIEDGLAVPREGASVTLETEHLTEAHVFRVSIELDDATVAACA